jgi:hypothetical protein
MFESFHSIQSRRSVDFTLSVQSSDFQTSLSANPANMPESCAVGNGSPRLALTASTEPGDAERASQRRVQVVPFDELTHDQLMKWESIRSTRPEFVTPFFSARFNGAVHASRGDVQVAVIHENNQSIGFLPFHRIGNVAYPAGVALTTLTTSSAIHRLGLIGSGCCDRST